MSGVRSRGLRATRAIRRSMSEFTYLSKRLPAILKAFAVGILAGYLFDFLHTPIPWMIGPMIAVATLNLMGVWMYSVPYGRQIGQVILGSAVSLYFTPTVVAELAANFTPNCGGHRSSVRGQRSRRANPESGLRRRRQVHLFRVSPGWRHGDGRAGRAPRRSNCAGGCCP